MPFRSFAEYITNSLHAAVSLTFGFLVGLPATIVAMVQGEWVLMGISIAGAWLAFLYGCRKYPIQDILDNAKRDRQENFDLKARNAKLAAENEALLVRLSHLEENSKTTRVENPKPDKS